MNKKKTFIISTVILSVAVVVTILIFKTEPKAERGGATKETAMLVDVIRVEKGNFQPTVTAMGVVEPSQDIELSPRVGGEVVSLGKNFTPGGFVNKGDILIQIDQADYRNTLQQKNSELRQALADLNIEMGRQNIAQKDFNMLNETLTREQEALILRKPQLDVVRAKAESARAAVDQAELNLKRTTVKAPFNAHILSRNVNLGSQVSAGENLGRLVGIETYWVVTGVPLSRLRWLKFPQNHKIAGSIVTIRNRSAWKKDESRQGRLYRLVGSLNDRTRMARVLVTVSDPLARNKTSQGLPPLMIGSFVEATIQAEEMKNVFRISRDYVRKKDTVWVMELDKLSIRPVEIILKDKDFAYISKGLNNQDMLVTTNLSTVVQGSKLRLKSGQPAGSEN